MQAAILAFLQAFSAAISAAPQVVALVEQAKAFIGALFTAKLITADQQTILFNHVDSLSAMAKAGLLGSHWDVEPDPTS